METSRPFWSDLILANGGEERYCAFPMKTVIFTFSLVLPLVAAGQAALTPDQCAQRASPSVAASQGKADFEKGAAPHLCCECGGDTRKNPPLAVAR